MKEFKGSKGILVFDDYQQKATVNVKGTPYTIATFSDITASTEEEYHKINKANAHLFIAAPDLLAAAQELVANLAPEDTRADALRSAIDKALNY